MGVLIRVHDNWVRVKDKQEPKQSLGAMSTQQRIHLIVSESIRMHSGGMTRIMALCDTERGVNTWATNWASEDLVGLAELRLSGARGPWAPTHLP